MFAGCNPAVSHQLCHLLIQHPMHNVCLPVFRHLLGRLAPMLGVWAILPQLYIRIHLHRLHEPLCDSGGWVLQRVLDIKCSQMQ